MRSPTTTTRVMMSPPCCLRCRRASRHASSHTSGRASNREKLNSFRPAYGVLTGHRTIVDAQALRESVRVVCQLGCASTLGTVEPAQYPPHWEAAVVLSDG